MQLGETIYHLRSQRNFSQGDLPERLEVSRQSVSRWETGSAIPELEKLIKLSELFEVSLDELVKGELPGRCDDIPCYGVAGCYTTWRSCICAMPPESVGG